MWGRLRAGLATQLSVVSLVLAVVPACGAASRPATDPAAGPLSKAAVPSAATTQRPTASATAQRTIPASAFAHHRPFTGPATRTFSQHTLDAAFVEAVNYAFLSGWDPALIVRSHLQLSLAGLAMARGPLTARGRASFDRTFADVVQGKQAAIRDLEQSVFFGVSAPGGLRPARDGRIVLNRRFSEASVGLDTAHGVRRLWITFAAQATIRMEDANGAHYAMPTSRIVRYWLVPNPRRTPGALPFLVDASVSHMSLKKPTRAG